MLIVEDSSEIEIAIYFPYQLKMLNSSILNLGTKTHGIRYYLWLSRGSIIYS